MKMKLYLITFLVLLSAGLRAQDVLKGTVTEQKSNSRIPNAFIKDNNNNQITLSDKSGKFEIRTAPGHTLIISAPSYESDTLYVVDMTPKNIALIFRTISLHEVNISSKREVFDPHKEYPEIYTRSKVYVMSPSTWFSREGKNARRLKRYFKQQEEEGKVDEVFSMAYVSSIIPLKGQDLEDFMTLYRPTYAFVISNNSESMAVYINDSYKKFLALPPDKRKLQRLTAE